MTSPPFASSAPAAIPGSLPARGAGCQAQAPAGPVSATGRPASLGSVPAALGRAARAAACLLAGAFALALAAGAAQAQTPERLVSNYGKQTPDLVTADFDYAQAFTTGSNPLGYKLTHADIRMRGGTGTEPSYTVTIHSDASDSPGDSLGTLTNPDNWPASTGPGRHTASGDGITLAAGTTYWLVWDTVSSGNSGVDGFVRYETSADLEDGAAGWSIANGSLFRTFDLLAWGADSTSLVFSIHGNAIGTPPGFTSASVNLDKLTVTFDKPLDAGSAPAGSAFLVAVSTTDATFKVHSGTGTAAISGRTATVTLSGAVFEGDAATVSYVKPASNPIRDGSGNETASFSGERVTNASPARPALARAALTGTTLRLAFTTALSAEPNLANSAFTVKTAASGGNPTAVDLSGTPSVSGSVVTLTLASAPTAGHAVTVSYARPATGTRNRIAGVSGDVADFTDKEVTQMANRAPTWGTNLQSIESNAPIGILVHPALDLEQFSDPDGDDLTFTFSVSHPGAGVPNPGNIAGPDATYSQEGQILSFSYKSDLCVLANLDRPIRFGPGKRTHTTVVTVTASDPFGATASVVRKYKVTRSPDHHACPLFGDAVVDGAALTLTFEHRQAAANIRSSDLPASEFAVTVDGMPAAVTNVSLGTRTQSGPPANRWVTPVTLTLAEPVTFGQPVRVSYRPADGRNVNLVHFANEDVTNKAPDPAPPTVDAAAVDGTALTVTFDKALDAGSAPAGSAFTVTATLPDSASRTLRGTGTAGIDGAIVTVTLSEAVFPDETLTVSYAKPTSNPLRSTSPTEAASFSDRAATNATSETWPRPSAATVTDRTLTLTYDHHLDPASVPDPEQFGARLAGRMVAVARVALAGRTVTLTLAEAAGTGQVVTVDYHPARGTNAMAIKDLKGNKAATLARHPVTSTSSNRAPTVSNADALSKTQSLPFSVLTSVGFPENNFSDPDGDKLTFSVSADREDALQARFYQKGRIFAQTKNACELLNLDPPVDKPLVTTVTLTATDPVGASVSVDAKFSTPLKAGNCAPLASAAVRGKMLTLTYRSAPAAGWSPPASEFAVTVDGVAVALAGAPTVDGATVTLTLAEAVGRGSTVTVSHTPGPGPVTTGFTDRPVAVESTNNAPAYTKGSGWTPQPANAAPGKLITARLTFKDPDKDPDSDQELTVAASADRGSDVVRQARYHEPLDPASKGFRGVILQIQPVCALQKVTPVLPSPFETVVTVAATDSHDPPATRRVEFKAVTAWDEKDCPVLERAMMAGTGTLLKLVYDRDMTANSAAGSNFAVTVGGAARAVNSVEADGPVVELTLATPPPAGRPVRVSYAPSANGPSLVKSVDGEHAAGSFANLRVDVDNRRPQLVAATVEEAELTLTYDEALDPESVPASVKSFKVTRQFTGNDGNLAELEIAVATVTIDDRRVVLALAEAVNPETDEVHLNYVPGGNGGIRDIAGNSAAALRVIDVTHGPPPLPQSRGSSPGGGGGGGGPVDTAPVFGAPVASLALAVGEAMAPVTLPAAAGGDGALSYALSSAPAGLAGLSFDAATRRLSGTPAAAGRWEFTYTAHDADANLTPADAAVLTFRVSVEDARMAQVKQSVRRTLAAVARRALTSALDNIGARFAASVPASGLTLAGETVPLGTSGADAGLAGAEQTCASDGHGFHDATGQAFGRTGLGAGGGCAPVARSRTVDASELLHASAFSLALGAAEGSGMPSSAPLWSVWGRGDLGTFAGRPDGMRYEGELRTGWLGIDARAGPWVAGLAVSHGAGEADYSFNEAGVSGEGRLETELTALYPYGRWTVSDGLELRGVLGAGRGEAVHRLNGGPRETSDLSMWMGSAGVRQELPGLAGIDLAVRADASVARMETGDGPDYVDGLTADSWRLRAGLEASRRIPLDGDTALTPFVEAAARQDGGDGLEGTGMEIAGGLRYEASGLHLEARGRWLAAHSEEGAEERGVSVTARMGPGAHGRGLSLMLSPRWGAGTGGAEALWRDELPSLGAASGGEAAALDARVGYGVGVAPYGLLTPFAETGLSGEGDHRRLRLGTRFEATHLNLGVEVAGERREGGAAGPEHLLKLDLGLRF